MSSHPHADLPILEALIGRRLKRLPSDLPTSWTLWQRKTLNIHRGIIHLDLRGSAVSLERVRDDVRRTVRDCFRPSWWRGFGFGTILSLSEADDSLTQVADLIDVRNNGKGTWQWIILHFESPSAAIGVCTWTEGYLAPIYREFLEERRQAGCLCESHKKDMDAVLKALHAIRKLSPTNQALRVFGLD
jgi:hypothetical protein